MASREPAVRLLHATAPTCWWSWGYEGTLNRVRLVYGDQVETTLVQGVVYEDFDQWLRHYDLDIASYSAWAEESRQKMGVPMTTRLRRESFAPSATPVTLAVLAARLQGERVAARFSREVLRRHVVEGRDTTQPAELEDAARAAALDLARFRRDVSDEGARRAELHAEGRGLPAVRLGFWNLALQSADGRTVSLDHAFEPAEVERAIDRLAGAPLRKEAPTDVLGYLRAQGPTPTVEVRRVFAWSEDETRARLEALVKDGVATRRALAGDDFWEAL